MFLYYKNLCIFGVLVLNPFFLWHFMGDYTNIDTLTESCKYQIVLSSSSLGYTYNWYKKSFQTRKIPVGLSHGNYRNSIVEIEKKVLAHFIRFYVNCWILTTKSLRGHKRLQNNTYKVWHQFATWLNSSIPLA